MTDRHNSLVPQDLREAMEMMDRHTIRQATEAFIAELRRNPKGKTRAGEDVLTALRSIREFALMQKVGDCLIQSGRNNLKIRRQYAQSLIDQGNITAAITMLERIAEETRGKKLAEYREVMGLLGRAYKQIYMDAGEGRCAWKTRALQQAIAYYHAIYAADKGCYWHGINTAALLRRARRDGIAFDNFPSETTLAQEILQSIQRKRSRTFWDQAAAAEACIALGRHEDALQWMQAYLKANSLPAFHLGSFLRQLTQVWGLTPDHLPGSAIIPLISHELLHREGGSLPVSLEATRSALRPGTMDEGLEGILGETGMRSCNWWRRGQERAQTVAKICLKYEEDGIGTGFLMKAEDLALTPAADNDQVLVTNAHVVSDKVNDACYPDEVHINFELLEGENSKPFTVEKVLFTSPVGKLDVSILRLDRRVVGVTPSEWTKNLPTPGRSRVYVVGHPRGGSLAFSIQDNHLIAKKPPLLHYRAPTELGSSGSPVFNENWTLIAIHHAGGHKIRRIDGNKGFYPANEGICYRSVRDAIEEA